MIKEVRKEGYAAFVKGDATKALRNYWAGGSQTGCNKQTITEDINKVTIESNVRTLEFYINWFNENHKNQVEFEIKRVLYIEKKEIVIE